MKIKLEIRHYMIFFLGILAIASMFNYGFKQVFLHILAGLLSALVLDCIINYFKLKRFIISPSTIITALIVSEVLSFDPGNHLLIVGLASAVAVISKHIITYKSRHIFNPAALGILVAAIFFPASISWWAASNIWLAITFGLIILYKLRKYELTLSYLITHTIIIAAIGYFTSAGILSSIGLTNVYFTAFMLIEPITSPVKKKARVIYGSLVAIVSIALLFIFPTLDHSILGLLIANATSRVLEKV